MAKFLSESKLNAGIEDIFKDAEEELVIISPYIKLHMRIKDILKSKKENHKLKITIVFGKNEGDITMSFAKEEFDFFKDFSYIKIRYDKRLHAKYYANENAAILSSMNLYEYSQDNNIEFGILTKKSRIGNLIGDSIDGEAFNYFENVIDNSELLYERKPDYKRKNFGLSEEYTHSTTEIDKLSSKYNTQLTQKKGTVELKNDSNGYCIRTGVQIPFNIKTPLSNMAYKSWVKFGNKEFNEKYCHYSGEESNGDTSFEKPILGKNWKKAKKVFAFA